MNFLKEIFKTFLYQPLFNALILLYAYLPGHDFGIAIIVLTILIRLLLYPLMTQSIRSQKVLAGIQTKIQEIKQRCKNDKEREMKETVELYRREKINPLGFLLPLLIQFPILVALYQVLWRGIEVQRFTYLYSFVPNPGLVDPTFLGIMDLSKPSLILAIFCAVAQFFQSKMAAPQIKKNNQGDDKVAHLSNAMQKQMLYFFPAITVLFLMKLPAAIGLYWLVTTLFSIIQQYFVFKKTYVGQK